MEIKILCPLWGHENEQPADLFSRAKDAGFDGIDGWLPDDVLARKQFLRSLRQAGLPVVVQQYRAVGTTIQNYSDSFQDQLEQAMEAEPILINSHSGTDAISSVSENPLPSKTRGSYARPSPQTISVAFIRMTPCSTGSGQPVLML